MPIRREFVDWAKPALPAVIDRLKADYSIAGFCDLSKVIAVFPGSRAGRRFLELLAEKTGGRNIPPEVVTVGALPERLYQPKRPFANTLTQEFAWVEALQQIPRDRLSLVLSQIPPDEDVDAWIALGRMISAQHTELTADRIDFSDVAKRGAELPEFDESARWEALHDVQKAYLALLDSLDLWDIHTARLVAIDQQECRTDRDIVIVGAADLNQTLRAMLDQVADRVTAYVHAPLALADLFDSHGCLVPDAWEDRDVEIAAGQILVVDRPVDQADAVVRTLGALGGQRRVEDITVGLGDERLALPIQRRLEENEIPSAWVVARTLPETGPYRLLAAIADNLESGNLATTFAALIRHPDMTNWLRQQELEPGWLTAVDGYFASHFQRRLGEWLGNSAETETAQQVTEQVDSLLGPLSSGMRPLADWTRPLIQLLLTIYGHRKFDRNLDADRILIEAVQTIQEALEEHAELPTQLVPSVSAAQAIRLTLEEVLQKTLPQTPADDALSLLGWLELPLDDAPVLILTGCNEGMIPSSINSHLFLPNALRRHLGVTDNARRYARDAYALSALLHSREEITVIAGRRDMENEPLTPSRLLFAAAPEEIARRVEQFYGQPAPSRPTRSPFRATQPQSGFTIPRPVPLETPVVEIRVTAFRDYLRSPYRFYLRHVLGLSDSQQAAGELDAPAFGNLIHDVLSEFGQGPLRESVDDREIRAFLQEQLDKLVLETFGREIAVPIRVQIEQARARLHVFAGWQAEWARQGWRIVFAEVPQKSTPVPFEVDPGRSIQLKGRIDRIDRNIRDGRWMIFDYKTGDAAKSPEKVHLEKKEWVDLQLPLYRHLARPLGVEGDIGLGYITLPRDMSAIKEQIAGWSDEDLDAADEVARRVVRAVWAEEFWKELPAEPGWLTEFGPICQDGVFDREAIV